MHYEILDKHIHKSPHMADRVIAVLGTATPLSDAIPHDDIRTIRASIAEFLTAHGHPIEAGPIEVQELDLQCGLLQAWARWSGDPAHHVAEWLRSGSPAGIEVPFELDGIFEPVGTEDPDCPDDLSSQLTPNYSGVETDPAALAIIDGYIEKGWLR